MRDRRETNRNRIKNKLDSFDKPAPHHFKSQGSYVDKTMVQYPDKDYDIDDGVYFKKEDLDGPLGAEMSSLDARKMVYDALNDASFNTPPELHTNCIRVIYNTGYNVDIPVYRIFESEDIFGNTIEKYELAGASWFESDAKALGPWFNENNKIQSPDELNGRQFRRIVRLIKKFASSRNSWRARILSGFGITVLAAECYIPWKDRDDKSLIATLKSMYSRLQYNLIINCPVKPYDEITSANDSKARYFLERLEDMIEKLDTIETSDDEVTVMNNWSQIFNNSFFKDTIIEKSITNKPEETKSSFEILGAAAVGAGIAIAATSRSTVNANEPTEAVSKVGGRMNA